MARKVKLKLLARVCFTILFLSFLSLYFAFWTRSGGGVKSNAPLPAERTLPRTQLHPREGRWSKDNISGDNIIIKKHKLPSEISSSESLSHRQTVPNQIVLTLVVCGDRLNESLVVIKSALAFTTVTPLHLIIITEDGLQPKFHEEFARWPPESLRHLQVTVRPLSFPQDGRANEWKNLFKLCASQRLFIPSLLQDIDATLYVDTDVIFLRPLNAIWQFFTKMNESHLAAMTPEHEDYATGWYNRFAQHPYFKPLGVNSGVMLMNLTRMRAFQWESHLEPIYEKYKQKITWGDQDILNILFHYHPDKLFVYSCEWNYRTDHCMYTSVCKSAEKKGVAAVHGNRGVFHGVKQPAFKAIFDSFLNYNLGEDLKTHLLEPLRNSLKQTTSTNCGKLYSVFLKPVEEYISALA